jgi:hypothetical protein
LHAYAWQAVIPAEAGIQAIVMDGFWIPVFTGMTE